MAEPKPQSRIRQAERKLERPAAPEAAASLEQQFEDEMATVREALSRGRFEYLSNVTVAVERNGKPMEVTYDNETFTAEDRSEFLMAFWEDRQSKLFELRGGEPPAILEVPPSPEGASAQEVWDRNQEIYDFMKDVQMRITELELLAETNPERTAEYRQAIARHEIVVAKMRRQLEIVKEHEAKGEMAAEMTPLELGDWNTLRANQKARLEWEIEDVDIEIEQVRLFTDAEGLKTHVFELQALEAKKARLLHERSRLYREFLPEAVPPTLEKMLPATISPDLWNELLADSTVNGEARLAAYTDRLEMAREKIYDRLAHDEAYRQMEDAGLDGDVIDLVEVNGVWVSPMDADIEAAGTAAVKAMDVRHIPDTGRAIARIPDVKDPTPPDVVIVENLPVSDTPSGPSPELLGLWEEQRKRLEELEERGYMRMNGPLSQEALKRRKMDSGDGWTEGEGAELGRAAYEASDMADTAILGLAPGEPTGPAVEVAIEKDPEIGDAAAAVAAAALEEQRAESRSIWKSVREGAAAAGGYVPFLRERFRGVFTMGLTTLHKAEEFRAVTNELGLRIDELQLDTFVNVSEQRIADLAEVRGEAPPPGVLESLASRREHNAGVREQIKNEIHAKLQDQLGSKREGWMRKFFLGEDRTTADAKADNIITDEKVSAFMADLDMVMLREQESMELVTAEDYTRLLRKHFDENWYKRYFYAGLEALTAVSTGRGIYGIISKGWEAAAGAGAAAGTEEVIPSLAEGAMPEAPPLPDAAVIAGAEAGEFVVEAAADQAYMVASDGLGTAAREMIVNAGLDPATVGEETIAKMCLQGADQWGIGVQSTFESRGLWGTALRPTVERVGQEVFDKLMFPDAGMAWDTQMAAQPLPQPVVDRMLEVLAQQTAKGMLTS